MATNAYQPHYLCPLCVAFFQKATCFNFTPQELNLGGKHAPYMPQHILHSNRRSDVATAAAAGCHFCSIIAGLVAGCTGDHRHKGRKFTDEKGPIYVSIAVFKEEDWTFIMTLFGCPQDYIFSHSQRLNSYPLQIHPIKYGPDTLETVMKQPPPSCLKTTTFSEETADFVKGWILECETGHYECQNIDSFLVKDPLLLSPGPSPPPGLPRRLIDLNSLKDPAKIQLIVADETKFSYRYCAISYSWGRMTPYTMTSANIDEFLKEIKIEKLPKLLQDAIHIARGIGFQYLWIDSLCVMQNGKESQVASDDWYNQIGKINDIFGNAVVTIAASECFDGTESIITGRTPLANLACKLYPSTGLSYEAVPWCTPHCSLHRFENARYHLDSRAWVFQERILSPRTLHFTRNFLHLECRAELRCEATAGPWFEACHHSGAMSKADYRVLFALFGPNGLEDACAEAFLSFWHVLMTRYSNTSLCRPEDLLKALAGLGKQVHLKSGLTWSFGLWREHILRNMLWYMRGGKNDPRRERAPTWAWASIEAKKARIMYDPAIVVSLTAEVVKLPEITAFDKPSVMSENDTRYAVRLKGLLKPGAPDASRIGQEGTLEGVAFSNIQTHGNCTGIASFHPECPFHPDYDLPEKMVLYSLLIANMSRAQLSTDTHRGWETQAGLVLTPVQGHLGRYRRVGYFHHSMGQGILGPVWQNQSLFQGATMTEVEII